MDMDGEKKLQEALNALKNVIEKDEEAHSDINQERVDQLMFAYKAIKASVFMAPDIKVSLEKHAPYKSMGSISVEGDTIEFSDSKWFSRATEFCDNVEILPLINGRVRVVFTFHNLTK